MVTSFVVGNADGPWIAMKTTQKMTKTNVPAARPAGKLRFLNPHADLFPARSRQSHIQWPTEQQIQEVSRRLAGITRMGIRSEANGDYFNSGDLAYQIREIIQATADLFKKSQRIKRQAPCLPRPALHGAEAHQSAALPIPKTERQ